MLSFVVRFEWMLDYQGMVVLAGNLVWWTWEVEDVFKKVKLGGVNKLAMKNYAKKCQLQVPPGLKYFVFMFCFVLPSTKCFFVLQIQELVEGVRNPKMKTLDRVKINTILIVDVHTRDITDGFVRDRYG